MHLTNSNNHLYMHRKYNTTTRESNLKCLFFSFNHILIKLLMEVSITILLLFVCNRAVYAQSTDKARLLSLLNQTEFFITAENYDKAAEVCDQAIVLFKKLGANNDLNTISKLHIISHAYSEKKMFNEAAKTESILVEIFPVAIPENIVDYALYLNDLSLYLLEDNNIILAEKNVKKALSLIKNENDVNLAVIYVRAAEIYSKTIPQRIDLSIEYQKKAVDAFSKTYGKTNSTYLDELWYLANYYEKAEDFNNACNSYLEIIHIRADDDNEQNLEIFLPLLDRIIFCSRKINNTEIEKHYKEIAFAIKVQEQGYHKAKYSCVEFPTTKDSLDYLAISKELSSFREQISQSSTNNNRKQIQNNRNSYIAKQPDTYGKAYSLSIETVRNCLINNWQNAINFGIEALRIYDTLDIITDKYVWVLCCVAEAYHELDNPAKAYDYLLQAYELRDDYLSSDNIYYNGIPSDLALYCSQLGNYRDAIKYGHLAVIAKEPYIYSDNSYGYFNSLNNLATYYGAIGDDNTELEILLHLINRAEEIDPSSLDFPESPFLYNLATSYLANGDYDHAIETGLRVKEVREQYGEKSLISNIYLLLAKIYRRKGDLKEALNYAKHANSIQQEIGGDDNLSLSNTYDFLAMIYKDMRNSEEAERMECLAINLVYNNIINNFIDLSSDDRTSYWNKFSNLFNIWYPNYFYQGKTKDASELYNKCALFAKGILLNTDTELSKLIIESGDDNAFAKYQQLLHNRSILSKIASSDNLQIKVSKDSLRAETDKIERELLKECKVFGDYTMSMRTTWQDVQDALNPNDIAIEFISFPIIDKNDTILSKTVYAAIVLRKKDNAPHFIELFDESELNVIDKNNIYNEKLYNLIWGSLDNYLSGIDNVFFSPTGKLYNINIEVLPEIVGNNNEKKYYRLSSTRLLTNKNQVYQKINEKALVYGGIKYDTSVEELIADSKKYKYDKTDYRGNIDSLDLRYGWKYLPGTLVEVNTIESTLKKVAIPIQIYTDSLGTEAAFKSHNGESSKIIHIATHGFYYAESDSTKIKKANLDYWGNQIDIHSRSYIEDYSLTRSGLLLAGCNNTLNGTKMPNDIDDGILFAKEISDMNLKNIELITLSSCDSGLGDIKGDGVFGLQRAFKKAGAQSILMSLWKVDDNATCLLMSQFYENYLIKKLSKTESLKEAQKYVRTFEDGIFEDPKYWAAFIILDAK